MRRLGILVSVSLVLAVLVGGFAYFHFIVKPELIKRKIAERQHAPVTVSVEQARRESWEPKAPAIGTLRAVRGVDIASEVGGIIRDINIGSGEFVEEGTLLVQLDDSIEQADLRSWLSKLRRAELELARQRELFARTATPKSSLDDALASRDAAAASVDRVRAVIDQKTIETTFSGRLGIRKVDLGQYVAAGTVMVTLQQLTPILVDFPLPEQEVGWLAPGRAVEVSVDAAPGRVFGGKIKSIDAKVEEGTRNVLVRAELENPQALLLPGMFANINVVVGAPQQVITVPRTAVTYSLYGNSVFVVVEAPASGDAAKQLIVDRRFVRTGEEREDRVSILSGIKSDEQIVVAGQLKLQPHARVTIDNSKPLKAKKPRPPQ